MTISLTLKRTLVEEESKGWLRFDVVEATVPSEAALADDQVIVRVESWALALRNTPWTHWQSTLV